MKTSTPLLALAATLATGALSAAIGAPLKQRDTAVKIEYGSSIQNSAAYDVFQKTRVVYPVDQGQPPQRRQVPEPDPNRPVVTPEFLFVLQCTEPGFHGECLVFGAPPGRCVSYFDFQAANSTEISSHYNDKLSSISTNTGGSCQFYRFKGCNNKGDDRGLTSAYNYNLGVALKDDPRTVEYENEITSWRC